MSEPPPNVLHVVSERAMYKAGDSDKYVPWKFSHLLAARCAVARLLKVMCATGRPKTCLDNVDGGRVCMYTLRRSKNPTESLFGGTHGRQQN